LPPLVACWCRRVRVVCRGHRRRRGRQRWSHAWHRRDARRGPLCHNGRLVRRPGNAGDERRPRVCVQRPRSDARWIRQARRSRAGRARVNAGLRPARVLMKLLAASGNVFGPGIAWDGISWEGISWEAVSWEGVAWEAVSWEGVTWDGVTWDSVSWDLR